MQQARARAARAVAILALAAMFEASIVGQDAAHAGGAAPASQGLDTPSIVDAPLEAAGADGDVPRRKLIGWNEYDGPVFSARLGGGFLYDYSGYSQDADSKQQMELSADHDVRDFRLLLKGQLKFLPNTTYTIGYMYDKGKDEWRFRQTGIMIGVPRLRGAIFFGRTKEGFSTGKIMVGYQGWTMERATINDAFVPILADGIRWTGGIPSGKFVYNLGWFTDTRSENESFNKNDKQFAARGVWLPLTDTEKGVLHLALEARYGEANNGSLQYRSKPESFQAQDYAIDTGKFAAEYSNMLGIEAYYRPGPLMFGIEYFVNQVRSPEAGDPFFHGGDVFVAHLLTGETRPYNARGAYFNRVSPSRPLFDGGPGAWELVLRYSYSDLDSRTIEGGRFWRITPMVNWHLSDHVRLEFVTGYGLLNRFGTKGRTVFGQTRLQLQL
jgi:phosphate-selective porin OprO/OprP